MEYYYRKEVINGVEVQKYKELNFGDSYVHLFKTFFICSLQVILILVVLLTILTKELNLLD